MRHFNSISLKFQQINDSAAHLDHWLREISNHFYLEYNPVYGATLVHPARLTVHSRQYLGAASDAAQLSLPPTLPSRSGLSGLTIQA